MTTFLWVLAAIGAVVLASVLAIGLGRAGGETAGADVAAGSEKTRYERDNEQRLNLVALATALLLLGGLAALAIVLELA